MASGDRAVLPSRTENPLARRPEVQRRDKVLGHVDCIIAGVPCQDVSVAGKRAGLHGERTGLFFDFARILKELRPSWFVFENVPGLLSSNQGRDFAEVLRVLMVECGYGVSWRVLNSQYFGVAQRRRRVFIVGRFGEPCPAEILFERESGGGDSKASGEAGKDVAFALAASVRGTGDGHGNAWNTTYVANDYANGGFCESENSRPITGSPDRTRGAAIVARALANSGVSSGYRYDPNGEEYVVTALRHLDRGGADDNEAQGGHIVIQDVRGGTRDQTDAGRGVELDAAGEVDGAVRGDADDGAAPDANGMRDFAGLPEGMDSARYRALGNAETVQVLQWIARRISVFEDSDRRERPQSL